MRFIIIFIFLFTGSCSERGAIKISVPDDTIQYQFTKIFNIVEEFPVIHSTITRSDTSYEKDKLTINYFDKKDRIVKTEISNLFESDSRKIYRIFQIYDTLGRVIYDTLVKN